MHIDFLKPGINAEDIKKMNQSIKTGWLVPGKYTRELEQLMSKKYDKPAYMTSSCTAALHTALILAGVKKGDEVLTTPLSWVATTNVILYCGAKPKFVDVDPQTGLIDLDKIKITKKTKAIIAVNLYGQLVDMRKLKQIAGKVPIIEDSAHSLTVSPEAFATCFSFHAAKNITCGNGGMLLTKAPGVKRILRHGVENIDGKRVMTGFGYKYETTDFQAALLINQFQRLDKINAQRRKVCQRYAQMGINHPKGKNVSGHMFVIWVKNRDAIRDKLEKRGIETSIHYPAIHLEPYYQKLGFKKGSLPIAEKLGAETITLPTYALTKKQQEYIIKEVLHARGSNPT